MVLQSPLRESFELDVRGRFQLLKAQSAHKVLFSAEVGEIKSSLNSESLIVSVTQLLVRLSLYAFLGQLVYPGADMDLNGHIYVTRNVGDLDKLRAEAEELSKTLGSSLLVLPPGSRVSVDIVRINGH
jgi:hypothetical protein